MNRAFQIACESALAPLLVERLRRATKAMGLNAKVRHGQAIIIRNQRAELERKAQEIHDLKLELVKIKSEWVDAKGLSLERGREIEGLKLAREALEEKVKGLREEYLAYHRQVRDRERKRERERRKAKRLAEQRRKR